MPVLHIIFGSHSITAFGCFIDLFLFPVAVVFLTTVASTPKPPRSLTLHPYLLSLLTYCREQDGQADRQTGRQIDSGTRNHGEEGSPFTLSLMASGMAR